MGLALRSPLFTCIQKGLHAPGYSEVEFPGYPSICRQNICSVGKGLPSDKGILLQSNPIFRLVIYPPQKPTLYLNFSCRSTPECMPPGFLSWPPNYSRSSSGWTRDWWDIPCMKRLVRDGTWLLAMCQPGNESLSTSWSTRPSCGKHITQKSEETMAPML